MTALAWLIPAALFLGLLGLAGFLWALRSGQFEDLEGAAYRILDDDDEPAVADLPTGANERSQS
ncbi:MAG: cbb3-type cytochrome oxidase assembly protein CcoS [Alphaproteobacteria bacterium]|nr:cbb3-type cytochrome oxidase assembly protein CcoS [Alphaproteobacteria bacterium]